MIHLPILLLRETDKDCPKLCINLILPNMSLRPIWSIFMINNYNKLACRVCGKIQEDPPWDDDHILPLVSLDTGL
jgi:hypothetical protein